MALTLSKIDVVKFGDFELLPQMDKEQKMRVRSLEIKQDSYEDAIDVLARCFGSENTERVREFMEKHMFYLDFVRLQTYLTQGASGLESLDDRMEKMLDKEMDRRLEEARAASEENHE